jgi:hypothetical protein
MMKLRGFLLGVVFAAIAVGFAYAVPRAVDLASAPDDNKAVQSQDQDEHDKPKNDQGDDAQSGTDANDETKNDDESEQGDESGSDGDAGSENGDQHGKAVSTAAHCAVQGSAHGDLVSSIAQDKGATVADAEAACATALASSSSDDESSDGNSEGHGKPDKPDKEPKDDHGNSGKSHDETDDDEAEAPPETDEPEDVKAPNNSGGNGNGHDKPK